MKEDIAIFLDLDNMVIAADEVGLVFDVNLILDDLAKNSEGRIALQRAYGDWRQKSNQTRNIAAAGFELQSSVPLGNSSKNLADMQLVVDAMSTLVDGHEYNAYVLISGDRDFAPLVQALRKRGKHVIGCGVKHATSASLARLCDRYIYYDQLAQLSYKMHGEQLGELIDRAMRQLLQEKRRVPASLLKQRIQALSKGAFSRSPQARTSFRKLLGDYPSLVKLCQNGTTLYVCRPDQKDVDDVPPNDSGRQDDIEHLLRQSLDELLGDKGRVRASLLKQRMQERSRGAFDEAQRGHKSFRKFLERFSEIVRIEQDGSTLFASRASGDGTAKGEGPSIKLNAVESADLLRQSLGELLGDQDRARASLLKQHMIERSSGAFDERDLGFDTFRAFLESHQPVVQVQQRGTTLLVRRADGYIAPQERYLYYRTQLKKRGLRVVPASVRLVILRDLVDLLERQPGPAWSRLIDHLAHHYRLQGKEAVSKSYIGDALRLARRAQIISAPEGDSLATARVHLTLNGRRHFQEAVIRCDATYLQELAQLDEPLNLEQAALAIYDTPGRARYLGVVLNRFAREAQ